METFAAITASVLWVIGGILAMIGGLSPAVLGYALLGGFGFTLGRIMVDNPVQRYNEFHEPAHRGWSNAEHRTATGSSRDGGVDL